MHVDPPSALRLELGANDLVMRTPDGSAARFARAPEGRCG